MVLFKIVLTKGKSVKRKLRATSSSQYDHVSDVYNIL